jgi:RimJ/RimL family protein N-acetyltransferase
MLSYKCLKNQAIKYLEYSLFPIQKHDIQLIRNWRNDQISVLRQQKIISADDQEEYFKKNIWPQYASKNPTEILMGLYLNNALIGYGGLVHISWQDRRAEVSFLLDPKRMQDFSLYEKDFYNYLILIKKLSNKELKFNRIYSETYAFRKEHISILEKANFQKEGTMRDHIIHEGSPMDSVIHGLVFDHFS